MTLTEHIDYTKNLFNAVANRLSCNNRLKLLQEALQQIEE